MALRGPFKDTMASTSTMLVTITKVTKVLSIMLVLLLKQSTITLSFNPNINRDQARIQAHNDVGHFNFETAPPGVEPPTVRKPPYSEVPVSCEGSGKSQVI